MSVKSGSVLLMLLTGMAVWSPETISADIETTLEGLEYRSDWSLAGWQSHYCYRRNGKTKFVLYGGDGRRRLEDHQRGCDLGEHIRRWCTCRDYWCCCSRRIRQQHYLCRHGRISDTWGDNQSGRRGLEVYRCRTNLVVCWARRHWSGLPNQDSPSKPDVVYVAAQGQI